MMKLDRFRWSATTIDEADLSQAFKGLADTRTEMGRRKNSPSQPEGRNKSLTLTGSMSAHLQGQSENPRDKIYAVLPTLKNIGAFDAHCTVAPDYKQAAARCAEGMKSIGCVLFIPWFRVCLAR
jgi:hypothetical protein